ESKVVDVDAVRRKFNEVWCMARPALLFLARPGELAVYDLNKPPQRTVDDWLNNTPVLDIAQSVRDIASKLSRYRREQIETGKLFEDHRFGSPDQRADKTLIDNLMHVRRSLMNAGLRGRHVKYAHALIGRSIFIRYLEDRKILEEKYF